MSQRDLFAAAALTGLIHAAWEWSQACAGDGEEDIGPADSWHYFEDSIGTCPGGYTNQPGGCLPMDPPSALVATAWKLADAMMAATEPAPEPSP